MHTKSARMNLIEVTPKKKKKKKKPFNMVPGYQLSLLLSYRYLPPYTTFIPPNVHVHEEFPENGKQSQNRKKTFMECLIFSQLSYLAIFIILICITDRQKMEEDPLNFNVLNVTIVLKVYKLFFPHFLSLSLLFSYYIISSDLMHVIIRMRHKVY